MNLHKTKICWATHTWNPVSGCLHGCEYCYAKRQVERWMPHATERPMVDPQTGATGILSEGKDHPKCWRMSRPTKLEDGASGGYTRSTPYPKGFDPTLHAYMMDFPIKREIPSRIFVCSMADLFGEWVPDVWIDTVFDTCLRAPQHTYLFLTKNPARYISLEKAGRLPHNPNFWYGTTATGPDKPFFIYDKVNTFLSIEPLLEPFTAEQYDGCLKTVGWVIVGAMTGPTRKKYQPRREWVQDIVDAAHREGVPVWMKDNLADAWGSELLREHPAGMVWPEDAAGEGLGNG